MESDALLVPAEDSARSLTDIHDIRSLVEVPSWAWLGWLLLAMVLAGLLYCAFLFWKKKRKTPEASEPLEPPHEKARRELESALEHLHDPERFCVLVSLAIRIYLEARFDLRAPERTTEEFLEELKDSNVSNVLTSDQKQSLADFLTECDLVKFAKSEPEAYELKCLYESAIRLVQETEPTLMQIEEPLMKT